MLPVSQSTWMGWLQTFAGSAISAVETIWLAVEAQFCWGGAHIPCLKHVKPHHMSVIRPAGIVIPWRSSWSTVSHPFKSYFCFFSNSLMYLFWLPFAVISHLIFNSPIRSSFTVLLHCLFISQKPRVFLPMSSFSSLLQKLHKWQFQ